MTPREGIERYLLCLAATDAALAEAMADGKHTMDGCLAYCDYRGLKMAREMAERSRGNACACIDDAEVHGWAVHYYCEDISVTDGEMAESKPKPAVPSAPKSTQSAPQSAPKQMTLFDF